MMFASRHYVAVRAAEPLWKVQRPGIIGNRLEGCSVRVLNSGIPVASGDGCVGCFVMAVSADSHFEWISVSGQANINFSGNWHLPGLMLLKRR